MLLLYTTCQGEFIYNNWLKEHPFFSEYKYMHFPNYINKDQIFNLKEIYDCDIFIYQPTEKYTTGDRNILSLLKPSCIKICIPYMYIELWPFYEEDGYYVGGEIIQNYKNQGYELNDILNLYDNGKLFFDLQNRFNNSIQYLKSKETKYCNIFASDFIIKYYKKYRLFNTQNHITGVLGCYLANEICKFLNIEEINISEFSQTHLGIGNRWKDTPYMGELEIEYLIDEGYDYYKNLIIFIFDNPDKIKIKGNYTYNY